MEKIEGKVFTYAQLSREEWSLPSGTSMATFGFGALKRTTKVVTGPAWTTVPKIRESPGYPITTFGELVTRCAHLAYGNRRFSLFYRGQGKDYLDKNGRSRLYSSIFRPEIGQNVLRKSRLKLRFDTLRTLRTKLRSNAGALDMRGRLHEHLEASVALLQHYELCATPLLDVTQSIRVAASFALMSGNPVGYVFVLGLSHPHSSISHFVDQEMTLVKLQSVCPYRALRPHYQEGYLVGRYPFSLTKESGDNLAYRMIAKLRLDNSDGGFWCGGFDPIPKEALLPSVDEYGTLLQSIVGKDI